MKRNKGIKVERMELILLLDRNPPPETANKAGELFAAVRGKNALFPVRTEHELQARAQCH